MNIERTASDPARDLLKSINLIEGAGLAAIADCIAAAAKVKPWSGEFFHSVTLLQQNIQYIHSMQISDDHLDSEDLQVINNHVESLRLLFSANFLTSSVQAAIQPNGPIGSENKVFLRAASEQIRSSKTYTVPNSEDIDLVVHTLDMIYADFDGVRLDNSIDFLRESLLRGAAEVKFIASRVDFFGFARLEAPVMELSAFLFTIAESDRREKRPERFKRSLAALSHLYGRFQELSKGYNVAKVGYEGAHWLISHLKDMP